MNTDTFLSLLQEHSEKQLLFAYHNQDLVALNYHITEVKNLTIEAVDCGGSFDSWKETLVQLWESPADAPSNTAMSCLKALGILQKVAKIKPLERAAELKFEYGNSQFHTANLPVKHYTVTQKALLISLGETKADCKAKEACGIPEVVETENNSCVPGSGCCG